MKKTKQQFLTDDRIQVKDLDYLKPRFRKAFGVIIRWVHDDLYYVQLDGVSHEAVLEADEMIPANW